MLVTPASVITMYPHVFRDLGYDIFTDVTPVSIVAGTAFALVVGPKIPASVADVASFVRWARAQPAAAQCGNAGSEDWRLGEGGLVGKELQPPGLVGGGQLIQEQAAEEA